MAKYTALTIGPIYNTIAKAKKTRQVWAASYFFSYIIGRLVKVAHEEKWGLFIPSEKALNENVFGAGLYGDRMYFKSKSLSIKSIQEAFEKIKIEITKDIADKLKRSPELEEIKKFLDEYINLHVVEYEFNEDDDVLKILNVLLDQAELNFHFPLKSDPDFLMEYLELPVKSRSLISKAAFGDNAEFGFPSIAEICLQHLIKRNQGIKAYFKEQENDDVYAKLSNESGVSVAPFMKYFGVLHADGDEISKVLEYIHNKFSFETRDDTLRKFSGSILDFAKKAANTINTYGGNAIYLGGEDIMAFVPIACENKDHKLITIFSLVAQLDEDFKNTIYKFSNELSKDLKPTLSFGISISYYKYPLNQAIKNSHEALKDAKSGKKDNLRISFLKHSGQVAECTIHKGNIQSWSQILKLVNHYVVEKEDDSILSSLIQKFRDPHFNSLLKISIDQNRIEYFMNNTMNEAPHRGVYKDFIGDIIEFAKIINKEYAVNDDSKNIIFTVMSLIKFINENPKKKIRNGILQD